VPPRILVGLTRRVPRDREDAYADGWLRLRNAATAAGANAWRFLSVSEPGTYLEFIEFRSGADPRHDDSVAGILDALDREVAPSASAEWVER
jgi:hypothetical protein